jgi:L-ascorbate metabolism protein UlaG (beta-lactamase superfamily)
MQLQFIRNATMRLTYGGHVLLLDPFLGAEGTIESFGGLAPNPIVDLPCTPQEVIAGTEMVLLSHLHIDHFDPLAQELLPKDLPVFCQPGDEERIAAMGFTNITPIAASVTWQGITITRTAGQHGTGEWIEKMGNVSGFIFEAAGEPKVYWAGDTIFYPPVAAILKEHQPDFTIVHASGAKFGDSDPIVMDSAQTIQTCQSTTGTVIAIHLESLDHGTVSRADLRAAADAAGIAPDRLLIPEDGDTLTLV